MANKILKLGKKFAGYVLTDKAYVKLIFRLNIHEKLNLKNPATYNQKLQWIKLYDHNPMYTDMCDKAEAKKYVADRIGDKYIIPTYGIWNNVEDIDFDSLPSKFVIKVTHDSGGLVICKDKSSLDVEETKKILKKALKNNYFRYSREWPYKNIKPRIIAEKLLEELGNDGAVSDYKVLCFDGIPKIIEVHRGRFSEQHTQDFYDVDWNSLSINQIGFSKSVNPIPKPEMLDKMLELSSLLAKNIPHLRVDWYCFDTQLFFGELTFFDGSGMNPFYPKSEGWDEKLGSWITLPSKTITN